MYPYVLLSPRVKSGEIFSKAQLVFIDSFRLCWLLCKVGLPTTAGGVGVWIRTTFSSVQ